MDKGNNLKDKVGRYRTTSLFWESRHPDYEPLYSIKEYDLEKPEGTYPSLKMIYLSYDHIPGYEYDFAKDIFGTWDHWVKLCNISQLRTDIQDWRDELDIRIKSQSLKAMMMASRDNDAKGVNAAKYLAEKGYEKKRGRPSKEEVSRETKIQSAANKELEADMERVGLKLVANQPGVH
jgi:hypothetical protein